MEKLGQFKSSLGAFLNSVQPLPKLSDKEIEYSSPITTKADAGTSNVVTSAGRLTENGLEKGFLTETLDDYDDRFVFASLFIHSAHHTTVFRISTNFCGLQRLARQHFGLFEAAAQRSPEL